MTAWLLPDARSLRSVRAHRRGTARGLSRSGRGPSQSSGDLLHLEVAVAVGMSEEKSLHFHASRHLVPQGEKGLDDADVRLVAQDPFGETLPVLLPGFDGLPGLIKMIAQHPADEEARVFGADAL